MAKINHHNFVDTINDMLVEAKKRGVIQLKYESDAWDGSNILVGKNEMINFGTCGYLGLEIHPEIIEKSIEFTRAFGTQFSVSRAYLTSKSNSLLEDLLSSIFFGKKVITFTSTTLTHAAVLPIIINNNDLIILDQQCHVSIQTAAQLLLPKGVPLEIVRHSNLEMLEHKIKNLRDKHDKIWYMIDGVYSMYGDVAPIHEINQLMKKYPQLHLYVDDAHGMSWHGKNGCGRIFEETLENERTIYVSTMAKGFGTMGGLVVFPTDSWYEKVILHGGPLAYSHPIPPPMMGAAIASSEIHLSEEIYPLQSKLKNRLDYTNSLLSQTNLPIMSFPETPIYFIGTGQPVVGYNLNKRILDEGFYVNIGMFPAVPVKNTGLRFTITNHNSQEEIKAFVDAIVYHYPKVLEEEAKNLNDVRKVFGLSLISVDQTDGRHKTAETKLTLKLKRSIGELDREIWDSCFYGKGNFDWNSLQLMEKAFSNNELREENWNFYYLLVEDENQLPVLATFFTGGIFKDDLTSPAEVSLTVEKRRLEDKYWLCSETLTMGSMFTEGEHLFLDKKNKNWKKAIELMLGKIHEIRETEKYNSLILRDFEEDDHELADVFHESGYFKVAMPNSNVIQGLEFASTDDFFQSLSPRSRRHIKKSVLAHVGDYVVEISSNLNEIELEKAYELYSNVCKRNFHINIFPYPFSLFQEINESENWEFIKLYLKNETSQILVSVGVCHKSDQVYNPILVGIDYDKNEEYSVYKQMLFQVCLRAIELKLKRINFGLTADIEKKKLGAKQVPKVAYMEIKDSYNLEILDKLL